MNKMVIIRTIILAVALINQSLVLAGYSPLPFDDVQVENAVTIVFTVVASMWSWYKNNDISKKDREKK